jgi:hypothetical protein
MRRPLKRTEKIIYILIQDAKFNTVLPAMNVKSYQNMYRRTFAEDIVKIFLMIFETEFFKVE